MAELYSQTIQETNRYLTNFVASYNLNGLVADFIAPGFQVKYEDGKYASYDKSQFTIWDDRIVGDEKAKTIQYVKLLNSNLSQVNEPLTGNAEGNVALN